MSRPRRSQCKEGTAPVGYLCLDTGCHDADFCIVKLHPCQRKPHYGEPCDCEARLALVVTHTRASTGGFGPDFCAECSQAISEWVQWPCEATRCLCQPGNPTYPVDVDCPAHGLAAVGPDPRDIEDAS